MFEYRHNSSSKGGPSKISNFEVRLLRTADDHGKGVVATIQGKANRLCDYGLLLKIRDTNLLGIFIYEISQNGREALKQFP